MNVGELKYMNAVPMSPSSVPASGEQENVGDETTA
jgi:hypothetical protein